MPYIKNENRTAYDEILDVLTKISTKGDLEYCVTKLMKIFMATREFRYSDLHDCVYAVQHSADEFRRLYLDKREDEAREINGDV
jgi:hypothetical protein